MLTWETHAGDLAFFWASVREQSPANAASPLSMKGNDFYEADKPQKAP